MEDSEECFNPFYTFLCNDTEVDTKQYEIVSFSILENNVATLSQNVIFQKVSCTTVESQAQLSQVRKPERVKWKGEK